MMMEKKNFEIYDLADEALENNPGILDRSYQTKHMKVREIEILKNGVFHGKKGNYISFEFLEGFSYSDYEASKKEIGKKIKTLVERKCKKKHPLILVVGLGNASFSSDALGPAVVNRIESTNHLHAWKEYPIDTKIACMIPGVMGKTGLESATIILSLIKEFNVDVVIAIDSLTTHDIARLNRVIQVTDCGISPGSGVNNFRKSLNEIYLKVPVIAIGVALALPAITFCNFTLETVSSYIEQANYKAAVKKVHQRVPETLLMTTKDVEQQISNLSALISDSINHAFNPQFAKRSHPLT